MRRPALPMYGRPEMPNRTSGGLQRTLWLNIEGHDTLATRAKDQCLSSRDRIHHLGRVPPRRRSLICARKWWKDGAAPVHESHLPIRLESYLPSLGRHGGELAPKGQAIEPRAVDRSAVAERGCGACRSARRTDRCRRRQHLSLGYHHDDRIEPDSHTDFAKLQRRSAARTSTGRSGCQ